MRIGAICRCGRGVLVLQYDEAKGYYVLVCCACKYKNPAPMDQIQEKLWGKDVLDGALY